jgi:hypothetical protein
MEQLVGVLLVMVLITGVIFAVINNPRFSKNIHVILAVISGIAIILLIFHQKAAHGFFLTFRDFFHHETAELGLATFAIGLLLGKYYAKHRN